MATATVTSDLDAKMEKVLQQTNPIATIAMHKGLDRVLAPAIIGWPVKTGTSRGSFEKLVRAVNDGLIEGVIQNDARTKSGIRYAFMVAKSWYTNASGKRIQQGNQWQALVVKPTQKESRRVAAEIALNLARAVGGVRG